MEATRNECGGFGERPLQTFSSIKDELRAAHLIRKARSLIRDTTGFELHQLPRMEIGDRTEGVSAQLHYSGPAGQSILIIYGRENLKSENVHHEMFHLAEDEWRMEKYGVEEPRSPISTSDFLLANSDPLSLTPVCTASWIHNEGVNEAGAYLFGHYSNQLRIANKEEVAVRVISAIETHVEAKVKSDADAMIEIIFDPVSRILSWSGSELVSCSILDDKRKLFDDAKLMLALATATVALEQRKFDIRSAARDLLESPASLFSALKVLGRDGVRDSLDNYVELSDSMNRSG